MRKIHSILFKPQTRVFHFVWLHFHLMDRKHHQSVSVSNISPPNSWLPTAALAIPAGIFVYFIRNSYSSLPSYQTYLMYCLGYWWYKTINNALYDIEHVFPYVTAPLASGLTKRTTSAVFLRLYIVRIPERDTRAVLCHWYTQYSAIKFMHSTIGLLDRRDLHWIRSLSSLGLEPPSLGTLLLYCAV